MPLPKPEAEFPPPAMRECLPKWEEWLGYFNGRGGARESFNALYETHTRYHNSYQEAGGVVGAAARGIFGRPKTTLHPKFSTIIHVPSARKIAMTSASAVFAQNPAVRSTDKRTQEALSALIADDFWAELQQAETEVSVLGGIYLTTQWDLDVSNKVSLKRVRADRAEPVFANGTLKSVTFIYKLSPLDRHSASVYRFCESHDVIDGEGVITYGLYQGSTSNFGRRVPLTEHPDAAAYASELDDLGDGHYTGLPFLDVVYLPNAKPQLLWEGHNARNLGVSDLFGVEQAMTELDFWTSFRAEEGRLNKTRIFIDENHVKGGQNGEGFEVDLDQSVYTILKPASGFMSVDDKSNGLQVLHTQGTMRNEQFQIAIDECWRKIASLSGFSIGSLETASSNDGTQTATGVRARKNTTERTADLKQTVWQATLKRLFRIMLTQQAALEGEPDYILDGITVDFPELDNQDSAEQANTITTLRGAGVMSKKTAIGMIHPDWNEEEILLERDEIRAELEGDGDKSAPVGDPKEFMVSDIPDNTITPEEAYNA